MINKELKSILFRKIKNKNTDKTLGYLDTLKSIIYFIGKASMLISNELITTDLNSENLVDKFDEYDVTMGLPYVFYKMEESYNPKHFISSEERRDILNTIIRHDNEMISLGEIYESFITSRERKELGQVYTPKEVVKSMVDEGINTNDIINNPYYKVIDPACGGGYFLIEVYNKLYRIFSENYNIIIKNNKDIKKDLKGGIHRFIIENNLWGRDIDSFAIFMTVYSLIVKGDYHKEIKINIEEGDGLVKKEDSLFSLLENKNSHILEHGNFDLVIGNPPYIGHKMMTKDYKNMLKKYYSDVYSDKSDISYCFFKRGYDLLKKGGKLLLISSRYFLESPSGKKLRVFLKDNYYVELLIDYYGYRLFKGIGVSPVIIKCIKGECIEGNTHIYKLNKVNKSNKKKIILKEDCSFNNFYITKDSLKDDVWLLMREDENKLYNKIDELGDYYLNEISSSNQGIISGCDKAFIVDKDTITNKNLEVDIIKPWVKNSHINKYNLLNSNLFILYTDMIDDINKYPNVLRHILPYSSKLNNRRECKKGIRKWYQLQWGRNIDVFKSPKIIFPYKSSNNKFALVYDEILFSADIYSISIDEKLKEEIPIEYLLGFLNSSLCEFYFKSVGKKLDESQYDYYPNKVMNLKIRVGEDKEEIKNRVNTLMNYYKELKDIDSNEENNKYYNYEKTVNDIKYEKDKINDYFFNLYNISTNEKEIIHRIY